MDRSLAASHCSYILTPRGKTLLICRIDLEKVQELGKHFRWEKPGTCPACGSSRLWGHGFVLRFFFGFAFGLWMKRWRCPDCGAVHTARPADYIPGMQYSYSVQKASIEVKLAGKSFLKTISRQNQQHWWKNFLSRSRESANWTCLHTFFRKGRETGQLPVTKRPIYRESWPAAVAPYLSFAVTVKPRPFNLE